MSADLFGVESPEPAPVRAASARRRGPVHLELLLDLGLGLDVAPEVELEERREARRAASCAAGVGHVTDATSPVCDGCGWDVRREIPRRLLT
jgi:hypothetical protein